MLPLSYRSPKTEVRESKIHGRGLFAAADIAKDEIVAVKGGHIVDRNTLREKITSPLGPVEIQVGRQSDGWTFTLHPFSRQMLQEVFPNSRNVIPGRVSMSVDLRAADDAVLMDMDAALRQACARVAAAGKLTIEVRQVVYFPPQPFAPELVEGIRSGAAALGLASMDVISGAGHDAVYLAQLAPTAMVFVPCADGISHNEIEDAQPAHLEAGCNVLLQAMLSSAGVSA